MMLNGREVILHGHGPMQSMFTDGPNRYDDDSFANEALRGEIHNTHVSDLFFSRRNIDALQHGIRYSVYVSSGRDKHIIGRQSDTDLLIVMKGIYLEHAVHLPGNTLRQVRSLNARVLEYVVPRVMTEIDTYLKYRFDVSTMPVPMDRPPMMSQKGTRVLELKRI